MFNQNADGLKGKTQQSNAISPLQAFEPARTRSQTNPRIGHSNTKLASLDINQADSRAGKPALHRHVVPFDSAMGRQERLDKKVPQNQ